MSNQNRRKLLKSIAAGTGAVVAGKSLPENWTKPVVDSVILPTHAQTSMRLFAGDGIVQASISDGSLGLASLASGLINAAHAGVEPGQARGTFCATEMGDSIEIKFQNNQDTVLRMGTVPVSGEGTISSVAFSPDYDCGADPGDPDWDMACTIDAITDDYIDISLDHYEDGWRTYRVSRATACNLPALTGEGSC